MEQVSITPDMATFEHAYMPRHDLSLPKYRSIKTHADIDALPREKTEYHVRIETYEDCEATIAELYCRVRPHGPKSFYLRFRHTTGTQVRTLYLGNAKKLSLTEYKIKAQRIVDQALIDGIPKKHPRTSGDTANTDLWFHYCQSKFVGQDWNKARQSVVERHIIGPYADAPISYLTRERLIELIEALSILEPGQARTLTKVLKTWFRWCVQAGSLSANPLTGFKPVIPRRRSADLSIIDLAKIYTVAGRIKGPWQLLIGLSMATTEAVTDLLPALAEDVDWQYASLWLSHKNDTAKWGEPDANAVHLNGLALEWLRPFEGQSGFIFASSRVKPNGQATLIPRERPLTWQPRLIAYLKEASGVQGDWGLREIRRSAVILSGRRKVEAQYADADHAEREKAVQAALNAWGRKLASAIEDQRWPFLETPLEEDVIL
jgi:hypothetical protein